MSKAGGKAMRAALVFVFVIAGFALGAAPVAAESKAQGCMFKGKELKGKVQIVNSFPDLKVQAVSTFPDACGKWQTVSSFPDFKVQIVKTFPDLKIEYVRTFPGVP